MICRFIQQKHIRVGKQHTRQCQTGLLPAAEMCHRHILVEICQTQPRQDGLNPPGIFHSGFHPRQQMVILILQIDGIRIIRKGGCQLFQFSRQQADISNHGIQVSANGFIGFKYISLSQVPNSRPGRAQVKSA